jgi:two-component system, chemotaxis family, chemotaxis protein CheY
MASILVVEDSNVMQVLYTQILSRMASLKLAFVKNGQQALHHIETKGLPDVVVLDINMPEMDGLEFLARFKDGRPEPPARVIIVSTEGRDDDLKRGLEAGASAYMTKPFKPEKLQDLIRGFIIGEKAGGTEP